MADEKLAPINAGKREGLSADSLKSYLESYLQAGVGGDGRPVRKVTLKSYRRDYQVIADLIPDIQLRNVRTPDINRLFKALIAKDGDEVRATSAYRNVRNYDILTTSIAATIAGAITYLAHMAQWGMIFGGYEREDDREGGGAFAAIAMMILAPFAALMLQLFLSRTREYSADETGARMVGQQYGLISALQKLGAYNQRIPTTALAPTTAALCIVKPVSYTHLDVYKRQA